MNSENINGLWSVEFNGSGESIGSGLIVFNEGKILGGDDSYYYRGEYTITDNLLKAILISKHYKGPLNSIFGPMSETHLSIEGAVSDKFIMGLGHSIKYPSMKMSFKLQRLSN
jgi:hypothetical protein